MSAGRLPERLLLQQARTKETAVALDEFGFEVVASSLRADSRDMKTFVEVLASKLTGALPDQTVVERKGGLFSREKPVHRIQVSLGESRYELKASGAHVDTTRARAVRGIVLKTEQVALHDWIDALSRDLAEYAQSSEQARMALERLLQG
jgi:hypothetical protein